MEEDKGEAVGGQGGDRGDQGEAVGGKVSHPLVYHVTAQQVTKKI